MSRVLVAPLALPETAWINCSLPLVGTAAQSVVWVGGIVAGAEVIGGGARAAFSESVTPGIIGEDCGSGESAGGSWN